jgi:hypothetical protein
MMIIASTMFELFLVCEVSDSEGIMREDKSWFLYQYRCGERFAAAQQNEFLLLGHGLVLKKL